MSNESKEELKIIVKKLEKNLEIKKNLLNEQRKEIESLREILKKESFNDKLTGFYNHSAFESILLHKKYRAERTKKPFSIVLIDINNFKAINKKYGYLTGDEVLADFAKNLSKFLRAEDVIARWENDEFMIILSETNFDDAKIVEAKLKFFMKDLELKVDDAIISYTYCTGIGQYRFNESIEKVIERARDNFIADKKRFEIKNKYNKLIN